MDFKETRKLQHSNLLLFCVFAIVLGEVDYCQIEKEKCTLSSPHIGCNQTAITFKVNFMKKSILLYVCIKYGSNIL